MDRKSKIKNAIFSWYLKIWWLDVLYPFVLSAALFSGLTYLIYHGEKHRSISGQVESHFLYFSLRAASPRPLKVKNKVVTVSLREFDLKYLDFYEHRGYRDVTLQEYAKIIETLLQKGARYIVLNWMHGQKEAPDYTPLVQVLKSAPKDAKVVFGVQPKLQDYIPGELRKYAVVVESDPCALDVQVMCIYQSHWEDWIIQEVVRDTWSDKSIILEKQVISKNLPRIFPSYILYLNNVYDFQEFSYTEINDIWFSDDYFKDKAVFMGNSLVQKRLGDYVQLGRVGTSLTARDKDPRSVGTPYHQFWAQIAQLFIDNSLVTVIPEWLSFSLAIVLAIVITLILAYLGAPAALGLYLSVAILAPLLNALLIRFFYLYIPIFDTIYAGLSTFILVTFSRLSLESFRQWRLSFQSKEDQEVADVKGNFISLVSHNLNTPVAKMQGMLDVLSQLPVKSEIKKELIRAGALVAKIQLCIRNVLVATAIEDKRLNHEPMNLFAIQKEFLSLMMPPLKKMGIKVDLKLPSSHEQLAHIPLHFDKRALATAIGSLTLLFSEGRVDDSDKILLTLEVLEYQTKDQSGIRECLVCALSSTGPGISEVIREYLLKPVSRDNHRNLLGASLLEDVSSHLIKRIVKTYNGELIIPSEKDKKEIKITLYPSG